MRPERTVIVPSVRSARSAAGDLQVGVEMEAAEVAVEDAEVVAGDAQVDLPTWRSARDTPAPPVTCSVWPSLSAICEAAHVDAIRLQRRCRRRWP